MLTDFASPKVVCRPALPSDASDVLEFTKFIWDGHDYIQFVWSDWLADPQGLLAVAEYGGHAVALGKLSWISPGQWWLEGLRVDPKYQGLKIGSHIFEYLDDWWRHQGGGAVRLMTESRRVQVHHLCGRLGYTKLGEVRSHAAAASKVSRDAFQPVQEEEATQAMDFASANLAESSGLMDSGWRFSAPDEPALAELAAAGRLYWWNDSQGRGLLACWEDEDEGERVLGIGFAAVAGRALAPMLADARSLAGRLGFGRVVWLAPAKEPVEAALREAAYKTDWDVTAYLFGKNQRA